MVRIHGAPVHSYRNAAAEHAAVGGDAAARERRAASLAGPAEKRQPGIWGRPLHARRTRSVSFLQTFLERRLCHSFALASTHFGLFCSFFGTGFATAATGRLNMLSGFLTRWGSSPKSARGIAGGEILTLSRSAKSMSPSRRSHKIFSAGAESGL